MMDGDYSAKESMTVLKIIEDVIQGVSIDIKIKEQIIRKLAHFSEFAVLGVLLAADTVMAAKRCAECNVFPFFLCIVTALIDETIQLRSPGRNSSVVDVWIDFAGASVGIAVFMLICYLARKKGMDLRNF